VLEKKNLLIKYFSTEPEGIPYWVTWVLPVRITTSSSLPSQRFSILVHCTSPFSLVTAKKTCSKLITFYT